MIEIRQLTAEEGRGCISALAGVLLDCVQGGASVSFMNTLTQMEAEEFYRKAVADVAQGNRILLAAFDGADLVGTVQIVTSTPPNQPHRADVAKLLVKQSARGKGIAKQLMKEVERASREVGRSLLVLDTVTGDPAEFLYSSLGWSKVGIIPRYALYPDGRWCDTTVFYKWLD